MRLLLDTHLLLWALIEPEKLGAEVRGLIEDQQNEVLFSAASIWEVAIKAGLGRPDFAFDPHEVARGAIEAGFVELPVRVDAAAQVAGLRRTIATPSTAC